MDNINDNYCSYKFNDIMEKCGMKNRYQIISLLIIFCLYGTSEFIAIALPLIEINPYVIYMDSDMNRNFTEQVNYEICQNKLKKYKYVIDFQRSKSSLVTDFDIFCSEHLTGFVGSILFFGVMIGSFFSYLFSDKFGRKKTVILFSFFYSINMMGFFLINDLHMLYFFLFTAGFNYSIIILSGIILLNEVLDVSLTAIFTTIIYNAYPFFGAFYSILFKEINNWRIFFTINGLFHFIFTLFLIMYIEESPRFFFGKKDMKSLYKCFLKIAISNNIDFNYTEEEFILIMKKENFTGKEIEMYNSENSSNKKKVNDNIQINSYIDNGNLININQ
jgi:MFS family permease